ncbi:hypothetical protein FQN54_004320 [Arachnomyces sp. PD_36]|nr:hypothetical protein FQN54_004320 [Arachnomyces sp. PD_36]
MVAPESRPWRPYPLTIGWKRRPSSILDDLLELKDASKQHGLEVILQLNPNEIKSPASRWSLRHLIAYRLLTRPDKAFLPTLEPGHDLRCPICLPDQPHPQKLDGLRIANVLGDTPQNIHSSSEGELMRLPDGFFWVALARAVRSEAFAEARVYPQRERNRVERDGFVNSANAILGSSSPTMPSASEFGSDRDEVDEDEHDARRNKPEEVTAHLAICFLQLALHLCLIQDCSELMGMEIRPRVERSMTASIGDEILIVAEDDGGVCRMRRFRDGWIEENPYLALLEAKRSFKDLGFDV